MNLMISWSLGEPQRENIAISAISAFFWYTLPSGKPLHNYGKSPCFMGKSTINGDFPISFLVCLPEGKMWKHIPKPLLSASQNFSPSTIRTSSRSLDPHNISGAFGRHSSPGSCKIHSTWRGKYENLDVWHSKTKNLVISRHILLYLVIL